MVFFFFFKQKTAYEMRISDWSSDVCSSDLQGATDLGLDVTSLPLYYGLTEAAWKHWARVWDVDYDWFQGRFDEVPAKGGRKARSRKENMRSEEHTSELQSLMRISYAVFCLNKQRANQYRLEPTKLSPCYRTNHNRQ